MNFIIFAKVKNDRNRTCRSTEGFNTPVCFWRAAILKNKTTINTNF